MWCKIRSVGSPVRESRTPGSVGGVPCEGYVYQPRAEFSMTDEEW